MENDKSDNLIEIKCGHVFHFECIMQWYHNTIMYDSQKIDFPCPYCRQFVVIKKIPPKYDSFFKFYFFTKFKRQKCLVYKCKFHEFPLNEGKCSFHSFPFVNRHDIENIMNHIFEFFYMPLLIRKVLVHFGKACIDQNICLDEKMSQLKTIIYNEINFCQKDQGFLPTNSIYFLIKDFAHDNQIYLTNIFL